MPRVPRKKKNYTVSVPQHQKKVTQHATSANAQSAGLGGILKQKKFTRTKSKFFFYRGQNQKCPILQGVKVY